MLRIVTASVYLIVALPAGWYIWHLHYPLAVRLVGLGALLLGMVDGQRRRRARIVRTFQDLG
jgi:hypothetical protein